MILKEKIGIGRKQISWTKNSRQWTRLETFGEITQRETRKCFGMWSPTFNEVDRQTKRRVIDNC